MLAETAPAKISGARRLTFGVLALAALALVSIAGGLAFVADNERAQNIEHEIAISRNLVATLDEHVSRAFGSVDQMLIGFAHAAFEHGPGSQLGARDETAVRDQMRSVAGLSRLHAAASDGSSLDVEADRARAIPMPPIGELLDRHRDDPSTALAVSTRKTDPASGRAFVIASRRVDNPDGSFAGAVAGIMDLGYFAAFYDSIRVGTAGTVVLWHTDGTVLVRNPEDGQAGRNLRGGPLHQRFGAGEISGTFRVVSPLDGIERYLSFRRVLGTPLAVSVAVSIDDALADWRQQTERNGALAGLLAVLVLGGAVLLVHGLRAREKILAALSESEARFRDYANTTSDWFWEQDADLRFTYISDAARQFSVRNPNDYIGKTREEIGVQGLTADRWKELGVDLAARRKFSFVGQRLTRDGALHWFRIAGTPMFDPSGTFTGYRGTGQDITAEVEARRAADDNRRLLRQVIESLPARIAVKDRDMRYVLVNSRQAELLGVGADDVVGRRIEDFPVDGIRGDEAASYVADMTEIDRRVLETGRAELFRELVLRRANGAVEVSLSSYIPILDTDGAPGWILKVGLDITDRKRTEAELARQRELLAAVVNAVPARVNVKDSERRIILANPAQAALFGLKPDEMIGRRIGELFNLSHNSSIVREFAESADARDARVLASGKADLLREVQWADREGRIFTDIVSKVPIPGPDGRPFAVLTVALDITERKNTEESLKRAKEQAEIANRAKSSFLANMSHELRTPLNAIIGFSELIALDAESLRNPKHKGYLGDIHDSGLHLLDIINDILDLSRIEADRLELKEADIDTARLFASCFRLVGERAKSSGVALTLGADNVPTFKADPVRMKQILINILSNAVKFTPKGGNVTAGIVRLPTGDIELAVSDTGIGMTERDIETALSPFGQVSETVTKSHDGVGLGLPLTRALAQLHGGHLGIESAVGKGTTIRIVLPGWRAPVIPARPESDAA